MESGSFSQLWGQGGVGGKGNSYCSVHRLQLGQYNDSTMTKEEMALGLQGARRI